MTHTYTRHGKQIPRHMAVDANGICLPGVTVSVSTMMSDAASPTAIFVRDETDGERAAQARYTDRMTRRTPAADAVEDAAYSAYAKRFNRKPTTDGLSPAEAEAAAHAAYTERFNRKKGA